MITEVLTQRYGKKTTARRLQEYCIARGIEIPNIDGALIRPIYGALHRIAVAPQAPPEVAAAPATSVNSAAEEVWAIIVETRQHANLEFVVGQFCGRLGVRVQLFHGTENESFIHRSSISRLIEQETVILTPLRAASLTESKYNSLFLSKLFWHSVVGRRKVLVFQTDAILCPNSDYHLQDFLTFDYIGARWPNQRPVGMVCHGGNGGLSLRDWEKTTECLERFPAQYWPGGEDGYFAFHIELMGGRVGTPLECAKFATQGDFLARSFGAHKISLLSRADQERFLEYCPESKILLRGAQG